MKLVEEQGFWDELATAAVDYTYLQSWQMGELNRASGREVVRVMWEGQAGQPVAVAQFAIINARRGKLLQARNGPLFLPTFFAQAPEEQDELLRVVARDIAGLGADKGCDYIRVHPMWELSSDRSAGLLATIHKLGFKPAQLHNVDAEKTLILDLTPTVETVLANMHRKTRYNIRKAEKYEVQVDGWEFADGGWKLIAGGQSAAFDPVEEFFNVHHQTTLRHKFSSNSANYYQKYVAALNGDRSGRTGVDVYLAKFEGKYIAGALIVYYGDKAFYTDGGSLSEFSRVPASYLIQWNAIQRAKARGCTSYNFWSGVVPDPLDKNHPWAGVDTFKRGFGGKQYDYPHIHDYGLTWKYPLVRLWEYIERNRRGY